MRDCVRFKLAAFAMVTLVAACTGYKPDASKPARYPKAQYHTVVSGDTLYSVAWEAGRDYRDVARWNGISSPYLLRPGQKIRLFPQQREGSGRIVVAAGDTLYSLAEQVNVNYRDLARWNNISAPYVIRPGQVLRTTPPDTRASTAKPSSSSKGKRSAANTSPSSGHAKAGTTTDRWLWPADGRVVARFSRGGTNKGLDIAGRRGQPIRAAAPGRVVYKGGGLRGYGQLIIVKHSRDFLSAYAHNERIYVTEGDVIKRGQKIAAMGSSGTDRVKLHFEIRYRGSPVDPLKYLPKR
ncbi:MAG: peptidoglycan DD-metalloendopeptidase family protein [Acidiferrobacterales bacterium]